MNQLLKAEFRKVFTVRSTYALVAICVAITAFIAFYVLGYRGAATAQNPAMLTAAAAIVVTNLIFLVSLIGALLVTHEYRYNTVMYTLTASNSRLKVLLAKVLVVSAIAVVVTLLLAGLAMLLAYLGVQFKGAPIVPQNIPFLDQIWRLAFFGWAYAMFAMIFAFIIRSQVGTIVALIFLPGTIEGLLGLLLKQNNFYLPFSALNSVLHESPFSHAKAALIVAIYVVVGLAIAALLFKKRDAN